MNRTNRIGRMGLASVVVGATLTSALAQVSQVGLADEAAVRAQPAPSTPAADIFFDPSDGASYRPEIDPRLPADVVYPGAYADLATTHVALPAASISFQFDSADIVPDQVGGAGVVRVFFDLGDTPILIDVDPSELPNDSSDDVAAAFADAFTEILHDRYGDDVSVRRDGAKFRIAVLNGKIVGPVKVGFWSDETTTRVTAVIATAADVDGSIYKVALKKVKFETGGPCYGPVERESPAGGELGDDAQFGGK